MCMLLYCMLSARMVVMRTPSTFPTLPARSKSAAMLCCVAQLVWRASPSNARKDKSFPSLWQSCLDAGTQLAGRLLHSRQRSSNFPCRFLPALKHSFWCACTHRNHIRSTTQAGCQIKTDGLEIMPESRDIMAWLRPHWLTPCRFVTHGDVWRNCAQSQCRVSNHIHSINL